MSKRGTGFPNWAYRTKRSFQRKKRADVRAAARALWELRMGVAYVPGYNEHFRPLMVHFDALYEAMRPGNWK